MDDNKESEEIREQPRANADPRRAEIDRKIEKAAGIFRLTEWLAELIALLMALGYLISLFTLEIGFWQGALRFIVGLVGVAILYLVVKAIISFMQLHIAYKEDISYSLRKRDEEDKK